MNIYLVSFTSSGMVVDQLPGYEVLALAMDLSPPTTPTK